MNPESTETSSDQAVPESYGGILDAGVTSDENNNVVELPDSITEKDIATSIDPEYFNYREYEARSKAIELVANALLPRTLNPTIYQILGDAQRIEQYILEGTVPIEPEEEPATPMLIEDPPAS